jgi:predicted RNase H-like nuclease (RuvC/YqgF family)
MDATTSRKNLLNEFDAVTSDTGKKVGEKPSQGSVEQDVRVLNKVMEKLVTDIQVLKADNAWLKKEIARLQNEQQLLADRVLDVSHSVGADQQLHEWQVDAAGEDALETPMSQREMFEKLNERDAKMRQYGRD